MPLGVELVVTVCVVVAATSVVGVPLPLCDTAIPEVELRVAVGDGVGLREVDCDLVAEQLTAAHVISRTLWLSVSLRYMTPGATRDASTPSGPCCWPPKKGSCVGPVVVKPPKRAFVPTPSALPLVRPLAPPPMSVSTRASSVDTG